MEPKEQHYYGRWAIVSGLLTLAFFGVSYFYAMQDSTVGFVVWLVFAMAWMYITINNVTGYLKNNRT